MTRCARSGGVIGAGRDHGARSDSTEDEPRRSEFVEGGDDGSSRDAEARRQRPWWRQGIPGPKPTLADRRHDPIGHSW